MYGVNPTWGAQTNAGRTHIATKGIVQSGLMLNLDAGVLSSYPGSGTAWTDLSGNGRNGTLSATSIGYDSSLGRGSLSFDGTDDFVQCSGSLTLTAATFIVWIRRNGDQQQYDGILFSRGTNVTGMLMGSSNQLGYMWNDNINTYNWSTGLILPNLSWSMCAITVTGSLATVYLYQANGLTTASQILTHDITIMNDIKIGQDDFGGRFFNGNIAQALIYNRALTATEIRQNYLATKSRYF